MKAQKGILPVVLFVLALSLNAEAASYTWTGGGTPASTWDVNGNWSATGFPGGSAADTAFFNTASTPVITSLGQTSVSFSALTLGTSQVGTVSISDSATADTLTLSGQNPITLSNSGQVLTLDLNTTFTSTSNSHGIALGSGTLNFGLAGGSAMILALADKNLTFTSGTVNIGPKVTLTGGGSTSSITAGAGATVNVGAGTYNGAFANGGLGASNGGTLNLQTTTSTRIQIGGTSGSGFYITANGVISSGIVQFLGGQSTGTFTLGSNIAYTSGAAVTATYNGGITLNNSSTGNFTNVLYAASGNIVKFNSALANNTSGNAYLLQISGGGTVVLGSTVANTYSASSTVANGTEVGNGTNTILQLNDTGGVALTGDTTVDSGSTVQLMGSAQNQMTTGTLTLNGAGGTKGGQTGTGSVAATTGALQSSTAANTLGAAIALGSDSTISADATAPLTLTGGIANGGHRLTVASTGNTTISTTGITGTGGLTKTSSGTLTLAVANTYSGSTTVSAGTLAVNDNLALQDSTLDTSGAGTVTLGSGVTTPTFGGLSGSTALAVEISSGYSSVTSLTLNPAAGVSDNYSGVIGDGASGMSVTISGSGSQTFSGNSTYSGGTTVNSGSLFVNNTAGSGTGSGAVQVNSGGTLGGSGTIAGPVTVNTTSAPAVLASGAPQAAYAYLNGGNGTVNGTGSGGGLTLTSTLLVNGGSTLTFALGSNIDGNGGFGIANPNTDSTYMTVQGAGDIFSDTTTKDNIFLTDLTSGAPVGSPTLTLRYQGAYVLIEGTAANFSNLVTTTDGVTDVLGANGFVLGVSTGSGTNYTPFNIEMVDINGNEIDTPTNYGGLQLYLDNGELELVPEPGTWALMLGGFALLAFIQRQRGARGRDPR
ncbi:MAG TPA: autotransporter-associated beta strand repeat-containing protein, partial [Candidatus Methylacidiphilales bacterium]